ncbi:MAG: DUF4157 domain-containing protein, partial [Pseudomonadota bacterium]
MQLKTAIENFSGFAMDDVKVHYNSNKPAQLQAHAYAQGSDIYLGPGQEQHLPHEAWHVVQQKQGRVKPTLQLKNKTTINHSDTLEKEADVMGHKIATHSKTIQQAVVPHGGNNASNPMANGPVVNRPVIQCRRKSLDISLLTPHYPEVEFYILQDGKFIASNEKTPYQTVLECYPVLGRDEWIWVRLDLLKGTATGYLRYAEVDKKTFTPSTVKQKVPGVIGFDSKVTLAPGEQPKKAQPISSGLYTWYQNQALLLEAYQHLNNAKTGETAAQRQQTQQDLALAILQSYAKVASIATPNKRYSMKKRQQVYGKRKRVEFDTSPVFEEAGTAYYRSHGTRGNLYQWLQERVSGDFPKNIGTLKVVADPSFIDVVRRKSPPQFKRVDNKTESASSVEPMPQINLQVNNLEGFADAINALYAGLAAGYTPQNTLLFDFSGMQCEPTAIAETIIGPAKNIIRQTAAKSTQPDALDKYLGGMMMLQHRGMNVFLMFNLGNTPMGIKEGDIDKTMQYSGQMVDPISIKKFMLAYESVENILKGQGIKIAQTTEWDEAKQQKMTLNSFLKNKHFLAFSALGKADKYTLPHYQRVHAAGIVSLLQGLQAISVGGLKGAVYAGLDHLFNHKGLTDLLRVSYHRMLAAMDYAVTVAKQDDMVQFLNQIEFLHDQLQIILGLVKPYVPATVFENALIKQLFMTPWNDSNNQSVLPRYITQPNSAYDYIPEMLTMGNKVRPKVYHKPSAMNTLSSILAATEKQKGDNRLNVLVLENTYYESVGYIDKMSKKYMSGAVDVNAYNVSRLNSAKNIQRGSGNNGNKDPRFDIFICESHHNVNELAEGYKQENIVDLIRHLLDKNLVADRFTVAMDGTMNYIRSVELQQILTAFKKEITSGRLNIAFFRSAQKFDMLGMDNYYGGYGVSINQDNAYKAF